MRKVTLFTAVITALTLIIAGCVSVKPNQLYIPVQNPNDTLFYPSSEIYSGHITSEVWATVSEKCISVNSTKDAAYKGDLGMHIKWNRQGEGCPWLGVGFGWDNWTPKDISSIKNNGAIEFWVRMVDGERPMLPWAFGIEDYGGSSAWLGMSSNALMADKVTTEWTRVVLPFSEFNWDEQDPDLSSIKQIIFQLEADGEVYLDEIKIVPYNGGYRKRINLQTLNENDFLVDGKMGDAIWSTDTNKFGSNQVHMALIDKYLCVAAKVIDPTPLSNPYEGQKIWDGDCFELAFSSDKNAPQTRGNYLSTDQHIGIALRKNLYAWDWRDERELKQVQMVAEKTEDGYILEAKIDLSELDVEPFIPGELYGVEIAVDHGNENGRDRQERFNEQSVAGFHINPRLWAQMYIVPPDQAVK